MKSHYVLRSNSNVFSFCLNTGKDTSGHKLMPQVKKHAQNKDNIIWPSSQEYGRHLTAHRSHHCVYLHHTPTHILLFTALSFYYSALCILLPRGTIIKHVNINTKHTHIRSRFLFNRPIFWSKFGVSAAWQACLSTQHLPTHVAPCLPRQGCTLHVPVSHSLLAYQLSLTTPPATSERWCTRQF